MENEVWKDIVGFENRYMISNFGRVKSLKYRHHNKIEILKQENNRGYKSFKINNLKWLFFCVFDSFFCLWYNLCR